MLHLDKGVAALPQPPETVFEETLSLVEAPVPGINPGDDLLALRLSGSVAHFREEAQGSFSVRKGPIIITKERVTRRC